MSDLMVREAAVPLPLRCIQVGGDQMEPTLRPWDFVLIVPADRFRVDDLYALDWCGVLNIYRCQWVGTEMLHVFGDRPGYVPHIIPRAQLDKMVRGRVVAEIRVTSPGAVEAAVQALADRLDQVGRGGT